VRPALPLVLLVALAGPAWAQLPSEGRTSYSRDDRIRIPFELRAGGRATKVVLYYSFEGGPWLEHESARAGEKRDFLFRADREGTYGFATMTYFSDGTSDPPRKDQLTEQRRAVFDKTPPRVNSVRAVARADGAPGLEWDIVDDHFDPKGIKLEFRWDGQGQYRPIERGVALGPRDSRHWELKPTDRMQVRVVATDRAGNRTDSDPVWVSGKDGGGDVPPKLPVANGASSGPRETDAPATGARAIQPTLTYLKTKTVQLHVNAVVGPSGLTKATLYWADEKLDWQKHKDEVGPKLAPETTTPDKPRMVPVDFTFQAPRDGLYHFVIVVENHRGANRRVPTRGTPGDVQVMVDETKPAVEIISTRVAPNGERGAVVDIRWKATDANMGPDPVKLEYAAVRADRPGEPGEWKAITPNWIDNVGQHTWTAPTGESHLFLIRVTCRDRAGNEGKAETPMPVNVDLAIPGVEGVDVAPGKGGGPGAMIPEMSDIKITPGIGPSPRGSGRD